MIDLFNNSVVMSSFLFLCFVLWLIALNHLTGLIKNNLNKTLDYVYCFYYICAIPVLIFLFLIACLFFIVFTLIIILGTFCLFIADLFDIRGNVCIDIMEKIKSYYFSIKIFLFNKPVENKNTPYTLNEVATAINNDTDTKTFLIKFDQMVANKQKLSNLDILNK